MILKLKLKNFKAIKDEISISFIGDKRTHRLTQNLVNNNNVAIAKSIAFYGANNVGKTCIIDSFMMIKDIMLGKKLDSVSYSTNLFSNDKNISFSISFINERLEESNFTYDCEFDATLKVYLKEKLTEVFIDEHKNIKENVVFNKDAKEKKLESIDSELNKISSFLQNDIPFLYSFNDESSKILRRYKNIFMNFANSLLIVRSYNIPIRNTLDILKSDNTKEKEFINEFIKKADLNLDNINYEKEPVFKLANNKGETINEEPLKNVDLIDQIHLLSTYKGRKVPSLVFDSTGTKKFEALSSYIIDALLNNKTLIIDEIDSSLHFSLTRSIVSLFNNSLNTFSQLIFSTHDSMILSNNNLFRKEQIKFVYKDNDSSKVISLDEFTSNENNVRETSDFLKMYQKGYFCKVPDPDFIKLLIDLKSKNNDK